MYLLLPPIRHLNFHDCEYLIASGPDFLSNELLRKGVWSEVVLNVSRLFYMGVDSPFILDIGANLGAYSIPIAKDLISQNGVVWAYEPLRIVFYQLCANIFLNRLENCYAHNIIISDAIGHYKVPEIDFDKNNNIGAFSLRDEYMAARCIQNGFKSGFNEIISKALDDTDVPKSPTLIKIDVEGMEINVIAGATQFLSRHNFPPILFEAWSQSWFDEDRRKLLSCIESLGYKIDRFSDSDYVAQHPSNAVRVRFEAVSNESLRIFRVK